MKHAIITLIIVFLFVLIVVPLMYIAFGKLKNPIDLFALSKVGNSGMATKKSNFISPNYIPESGGGTPRKQPFSYEKVQEDAERCMGQESGGPKLISEEYFILEKKEDAKLNIRNDKTGTTRYFEGFYPIAVTKKKGESSWDNFSDITMQLDMSCVKNGSTLSELFVAYNDGGIFMRDYVEYQIQTNRLDFTDKGVTVINGNTYYWYLFEGQDRIYKSKESGDTFYYSIFYSTLINNQFHYSAFNGKSDMYGTPRDFITQTQTFLSGTVYSNSTSVLNSNPQSTPSVDSQQDGGVNGSASTKTPSSTPAKYVPWTPAP